MRFGKAILGVSAALVMGTGLAQAGIMNLSALTGGQYEVIVWSGDGTPYTATAAAHPSLGSALAAFTYTGDINFVNTASNNGQNASLNTFGDFGFSSSNISNFNSADSLSQFLGTTMSLGNYVDNTYMAFIGQYSAPAGTSLTITHDDGASFYTIGANYSLNTVLSSPNPTPQTSTTGWLPSGTNVFGLVYVEANGSPSVLTATVDTPSTVPEPNTFALMGAGLLAMGLWTMRRRKSL